MVSIIPRVDLLGNTVVDWICKLSYFRLDTLLLSLTSVCINYNYNKELKYVEARTNYYNGDIHSVGSCIAIGTEEKFE